MKKKQVLLFLMLCLELFFVLPKGVFAETNKNLILYMPFDSSYSDSTKNNTVVSYGQFKYEAGKINKSIYLDGNGDYLDIGRGLNLNGDFSFSVWVNSESESRSDAALLAKYETNGYGPYDFYLSYNRPAFWVSNGSGGYKTCISDKKFETGKWYLLTYTYQNEKKKLTMYIDGEYDNSYSDIQLTSNDDRVTVGRQSLMFSPHSNLEYKGRLDDLRLYNRLLTTNEIKELYQMHTHLEEPNKTKNSVNYKFPYNGKRYTSIAYNDFIDNSNWMTVEETIIKSGKFDWANAVVSGITANSEDIPDDNNPAAINKLELTGSIISMIHGFVTGGRQGISNVKMKLQTNGRDNRMLLMFGEPIEAYYSGQKMWLRDILTKAHSGEAAYFLKASEDEDALIRKCFSGLNPGGKYSMYITFSKQKDYEDSPYKYSIVIGNNGKIYQYPIIHNGTKMEVYYTPENGKRTFAFDATQLVNSEKIKIDEQVGKDIIYFLKTGNWKKSTKKQTIKVTGKFTKIIGDKNFSLKAKAKSSLSYKSNNKRVATVNSKGIVEVKGIGTATITIMATGTEKYKAAISKVKIIVNPKSTKLTKTKRNSSKKATVQWKKVSDIDGYLIQYSVSSKFSKTKTKTVGKSYIVTSLKNLEKDKKYYVRICTFKRINGSYYYSKWSQKKIINSR